MALIGIMQGRLSPPVGGRIQAFPSATWAEEFALARTAGLDCIEWVYEEETERLNPLADAAGVDEIRSVADATGVPVASICADYYMRVRLIENGDVASPALDHLLALLERAAALGARYVLLPFVDDSALRTPADVEALGRVLRAALEAAERGAIEIHIETDLPAEVVADTLAAVDHPLVRANYDIGNAAALGLDPNVELPLLAPHLGSVHVKDRLRAGASVPLGEGAADFETCFELFREGGYDGTYILQAAREDGIAEVELARRNRSFVERLAAAR